jgi:hypothetical protein
LEAVSVIRLVLIALLFFLLSNLIFYIVEGPSRSPAPSPPAQEHKSGDNSQDSITKFGFWRMCTRRRGPSEVKCPLPVSSSAQFETSAPSDARHT